MVIKKTIAMAGMLVLSGCDAPREKLPVTFEPYIDYCENEYMTGVFMTLSDDEKWYSFSLPCEEKFSATSMENVKVVNSVSPGATKVGMTVLYEYQSVSDEERDHFIRNAAAAIGADVVTLKYAKAREGEDITLAMSYRVNHVSQK